MLCYVIVLRRISDYGYGPYAHFGYWTLVNDH